uniref:TIR domain-containing protein n=1 Tax=Setaria digitata TaxID=48799 RepID=A0A915PZG5_9BILA
MPRLIALDLSYNTIDHIAEDAFSKCPKLRQLDLSGNYLTNFNGALHNLQNLKRLNSSFNMIQLLQWDEFPATMTHLEMSNNQITLLSTTQRSRIRHVQLQRNRIMTLMDEQIPNTVEHLNLSDNLIHTIGNGTFRSKQFLSSLDLRKNQLSSLEIAAFMVDTLTTGHPIRLSVADNPLFCSCEMNWIRNNKDEKSLIDIVDDNQALCIDRIHKRQILLSDVTKDDLLCSYKQICEPNCICCQYGNCDCKSKCPDGCYCYHDITYTINIVSCSALKPDDRKNFSPKDLPMYATHVYLENMEIPVIRSHDFLGRTRLLHLHLNHSSVREIQPLAFNTLPSLQLLDLSGNHLIRLTGDELYRTNKITTLLLHNNQLLSLDNRLNEVLPQLRTITLHDNNLQDLPISIEQYGKQLTDITLGANLFRCDCSQRFRMQFWFSRNLDVIHDVSDIFCVENLTHAIHDNDTTILSAYPPNYGDDIFKIPMAQFIATANTTICAPIASGIFDSDGTTNTVLIIIVLSGITLITTGLVLLATLFFRKTKSVIVQRRYKVPPSFTGTHTTPGSSPLPLIHFDVFISYSKKDEKLIIDTLYRQLESEEYILCLLHRDGPNYNSRVHTISDELINQMECAQSLILVLTQHFLDNEWRTLQIKTSHQIFAKNRHKKLIALLGDGIEPNQLDAELGQILRKNTCIRMNDPLFWNLLHSALPVRISPSSCSGGSSQIYSDCYGSIVPSDIV